MKIIKKGHPSLTIKSEPVHPDEMEDVIKMGVTAKKLMIRHKGVGLAANQVDDLRRWFVWQMGTICINPSWRPAGRKVKSSEGCLSYVEPRKQFLKKRHAEIDAEWTNHQGEWFSKRLKGLAAIVFQHECDHLDGKNIWEGQ